jgi:AcrB/AcrD/AcrF family/Outer membrane efflux protein
VDLSLDDVVAEAWSNRPEAKAIDLSEKIAEQLIGIAQADLRPSLDLDAGYGWSVRRPEDFFGSKFSKWNVGLTLKIPIFDGFRTAGRVAQARADKAQIAQDRVALENQIRLEAKDGLDRLRVAKSVLDAADLNVSQAQKALDFANQARRDGLSRDEALVKAGSTRLRPIVMTTLAMIFGMLPLAFAIGAGAEMRAPMARAVIGGLITSTLLTLVVVPVVYTYLDGLRLVSVKEWLRARRRSRVPAERKAPAGVPVPGPSTPA